MIEIEQEQSENLLQRFFRIFSQISPQKKIILYISFGFFLILAIIFFSSLGSRSTNNQQAQNQQQESEQAEEIPTTKPTVLPTAEPEPTEIIPDLSNQTTLSIDPESFSLKVGEEKQISVVLENIPVAAVDIILKYNPEVVEVTNLQNGTIFERIIRNQIENGKVTYSASIAPEKKDSITTGPVFSLTLKALKPVPQSPIEFDQNETITALAGRNTLGMAKGTKMLIDL